MRTIHCYRLYERRLLIDDVVVRARGTPLPDGRGAGVRVCRRALERDGAVAPSCCNGRPSSGRPGHLLPTGRREEGGAVPLKTNPRRFSLPYPPITSSPRGSHPEVCRWWGWGRRLRVESRSAPGRLRGTALETLRPLCEELAGRMMGRRTDGDGRDEPQANWHPTFPIELPNSR